MIEYTNNDFGIFNEDQLQSRLCVVRKYVSKPIPEQPWSDDVPAVIPFHDNDDYDYDNNNNNNNNNSSTEGRRGGIIIGSARHAANMSLLKSMNVIAVLNCASGGIARLPVSEMEECGIGYSFTNCRQDSHTYPILHDKLQTPTRPDKLENLLSGKVDEYDERLICSKHLEASNALFAEVRRRNGEAAASQGDSRGQFVMFFCVAGQNRSAVLAIATMLIHGMSLESILKHCARQRPFVLENVGFQRQLVELEAIIDSLMTNNSDLKIRNRFSSHWDLVRGAASLSTYSHSQTKRIRGNDKNENQLDERKLMSSQLPILTGHDKVEIELLIPGLCSMEAQISRESTIPALKKCLVEHVNDNLLCHDKCPSKVAKAWLILAMFGSDDMWDLPLEVEAVELKVQLDRIKSMFGLNTRLKDGEPYVTWSVECRFALVIFSVVKFPTEPFSSLMDMTECDIDPSMRSDQVPWTFVHEERPNAPATLLENTLKATHLRAWDFVNGKAFASTLPTVFSFADDPRDKRAFMMVSRSAAMLQQFQSPGEGDILGMGNNAIVHRVQLKSTRPDGRNRDENWTTINVGLENGKRRSFSSLSEENDEEEWDAAVKRPFSLTKMLAFLQNSSEAGLAKRLRLANLLNSDKRVLYFYGIGLGLSTNAYNQNEYKFELMLLSKYDENFSSYTLRCFMEEYTTQLISVTDKSRRMSMERMQIEFSITAVKVLLVSLLYVSFFIFYLILHTLNSYYTHTIQFP